MSFIEEMNDIWNRFVGGSKDNQWYQELQAREAKYQVTYNQNGYIEPVRFIENSKVVGYAAKDVEGNRETSILFENDKGEGLLFKISMEETSIYDYDIQEGARGYGCNTFLLGDVAPLNCFLIDFFVRIGEEYSKRDGDMLSFYQAIEDGKNDADTNSLVI